MKGVIFWLLFLGTIVVLWFMFLGTLVGLVGNLFELIDYFKVVVLKIVDLIL